MKCPKPLWGFGWAGWCLLPIAAALAWVYFSGYDLRFHLLEAIYANFGWSGLLWFLTRPMFHQYIGLFNPGLGVWGVTIVWPAMWLYPKPIAWLWWMLVGAWCLLRSDAFVWFIQSPGAPPLGWLLGVAGPMLNRDSGALALCFVGDVLVLALATRSVLVIGTAVLASAAAVVEWSLASVQTIPLQWLLVYGWYGLVGAAMLWWAVTARLRWMRPGHCRGCGYDLRGLTAAVCPECGAAIPAAVGAAP